MVFCGVVIEADALRGVGHCGGGNADQGAVDRLPEVVLLRHLYCDGLGVRIRVWTAFGYAVGAGVRVAVRRRRHLYRGRRHLCVEAADL